MFFEKKYLQNDKKWNFGIIRAEKLCFLEKSSLFAVKIN